MSIFLNNHKIIPTIFPDKTSQVWKIPENYFNQTDINIIDWEFENEAEFIHVAQLVDLINSKCQFKPYLSIPYFPYARQDKEVSNLTTFAKSTFEKLLLSLDVRRIETFDIHSKSNIRHLTNITPQNQVNELLIDLNINVVVYPDKGAKTRYSTLIDHPSITLNKIRDQLTGELQMKGLVEPDAGLFLNGDKVLIVDDLCDGGGTFILATKELQNLGCSDIYLYTSHGIYSKGTQVLFDSGIKRIFNRKGEVK